MRKVGRRGKKLYKGYGKKREQIIERAHHRCEVMEFIRLNTAILANGTVWPSGTWRRCGKYHGMVDHITPRGMAGANSKWLNDERNLMYICIDHSEMGRYRTYREEKYKSLQMLYPDLDWSADGPWREFLSEQNDDAN